jgi:lambda family phage portal protein
MASKPGIIDRILEGFAPRWAAERVAARMSLENMRRFSARDYYGASRGRGTENWNVSGSDADTEVGKAAPLLRARSRDLVRNNPIAANAVQVLVSSMVGAGIRPRATTPDPDVNKRINALFAEWSTRCDFYGLTDFYGLQSLAVRQMIEGGEVISLRQHGRGMTVPLQIQLKEADHLDDAKLETGNGARRIIQGIEYDADGRRVAYWLLPDHPGSLNRTLSDRTQSVRVPAAQVAHMFERQRLQNRGVPWAAPVMRTLRDMDDWQVAELVRKKTEACLVGIVIGGDSDTPIAPKVQRSDGSQAEQFEPGMIAYANGAQDIKFNQPTGSGGLYEWMRVQGTIVSAGFRVPYALLTGDLSQSNFASSRVGLNEFRRMIDMMQWQIVIPMFCQPVWEWFVESAQLAGQISLDNVPVEWDPPSFESVNPLQDANADLIDVRSGFCSMPQMIAKRGYDPDAILDEQAAFLAKADALGLVFDTDPRRVSRGGQGQPTLPEDSSNN